MQAKLSVQTINEMQELRKKGYSLSEISQKLRIAKSTASRYSQNISVLPQYMDVLNAKRGGSKRKKELREQIALEEAKELIKDISNREKLLFLCALYWAEGSKKDFSLSNTDPNLIKIFIEGLREIFHLPTNRLRISIRIYEDLDKEACLQFWSKIINLPKKDFVNVNVLKGKKIGKLQYGMCRVRVSKGESLLKKIKAVNSTMVNNMSL